MLDPATRTLKVRAALENHGQKLKPEMFATIRVDVGKHVAIVVPECMAGTTGLEPATSAVTGQRSNQLSYVPRLFFNNLVICHIESSVSQLSQFSLFSTISLLWTQFLGTSGHQVDTKSGRRNDRSSLSDQWILAAHKSPGSSKSHP